MRMQEVIVKLREEAPKLDVGMKRVKANFARAKGLCLDLEMAASEEGRALLRKALFGAMTDFETEYERLHDSVNAICTINAEYKEKLGTARKRKQKDAPGQQMLDLGDQTPAPAPAGIPAVSVSHPSDDVTTSGIASRAAETSATPHT